MSDAPRTRKVAISYWDEDRLQTVKEIREVPIVEVEEDLMVILGDRYLPSMGGTASEIGAVVLNLLDVLATLVTMTSAHRSTPTDSGPRSSGSRPSPSLIPVWAERRLSQAMVRLSAEGESIAAWVHRPFDPVMVEKRCGVPGCGQLRRACGHTGADVARSKDSGYSE